MAVTFNTLKRHSKLYRDVYKRQPQIHLQEHLLIHLQIREIDERLPGKREAREWPFIRNLHFRIAFLEDVFGVGEVTGGAFAGVRNNCSGGLET